MIERVRIRIDAFLDVEPEVLDAAHGDALYVAQNELGHTGLDIINADEYDVEPDEEDEE